MFARAAIRAVRPAGKPRYASGNVLKLTAEPTPEWKAQLEAVRHHAGETTQLWRRISFYFCVPVTLCVVAWVRNVEAEHEAHIEHIKEEHGGELPDKPEYSYLNKRAKPFPWGMNTLFFNPHAQKDMSEAAE